MGFVALPFIIGFIILIIWFSGWFTVLVTNRPRSKYIGWILAVVILFGDIPLKNLQLKYLCEWKEHTDTIDSSEPLDLFVLSDGSGCDAVCLKALLKYKIKTIERRVKIPDPNLFTEKAGWYNFYLSTSEDPNCRLYKNHPKLEAGFVLPDGNCLASRFVDGEPLLESWFDISKQKKRGSIILPYSQIKTIRTEHSTKRVISILYYNYINEDWFFDELQWFLIGAGSNDNTCYADGIYRYPELIEDQISK